jgi:hypothetical protein
MRIVLATALLVALPGVPASTGCAQYCTLVGGRDGAAIDLEWTRPPAPGAYAVSIRADGQELTYEVEVLDGDGECLDAGRSMTFQTSLGVLTLGVSLCTAFAAYLDDGEPGGPAMIEVEVTRGTPASPPVEVIGQATIVPSYQVVFPNGSDCSPRLVVADDVGVVVDP